MRIHAYGGYAQAWVYGYMGVWGPWLDYPRYQFICTCAIGGDSAGASYLLYNKQHDGGDHHPLFPIIAHNFGDVGGLC